MDNRINNKKSINRRQMLEKLALFAVPVLTGGLLGFKLNPEQTESSRIDQKMGDEIPSKTTSSTSTPPPVSSVNTDNRTVAAEKDLAASPIETGYPNPENTTKNIANNYQPTSCESSCSMGCTGCGAGCANTCKTGCSGNCVYSCEGNCTGRCDGGCYNSCSGCTSCAGRCTSCTGTCYGCSGTCQGTCSGSCYGWS